MLMFTGEDSEVTKMSDRLDELTILRKEILRKKEDDKKEEVRLRAAVHLAKTRFKELYGDCDMVLVSSKRESARNTTLSLFAHDTKSGVPVQCKMRGLLVVNFVFGERTPMDKTLYNSLYPKEETVSVKVDKPQSKFESYLTQLFNEGKLTCEYYSYDLDSYEHDFQYLIDHTNGTTRVEGLMVRNVVMIRKCE